MSSAQVSTSKTSVTKGKRAEKIVWGTDHKNWTLKEWQNVLWTGRGKYIREESHEKD